MSGSGFHVHGPHDHALEPEHIEHDAANAATHKDEHKSHGGGFAQWVAIFTAVLATVGAIVSYQGGHTQNAALYFKNEAVLKKADASNQWALYQAKSTKQNLAELAEQLAADPDKKAAYAKEVIRYKGEKDEISVKAKEFEALSAEANRKSETSLYPHDKLAQAMTLIQIAISLAAICVLTRRKWMFGLAGVAAAGGLVYWALAFVVTGVPGGH
jgi:hypothetical protein